MNNSVFNGIFTESNITISEFMAIIGIGLLVGLLTSITHCIKNRSSVGFIVTLTLIPSIVAVIILMVNGNVGAGIAVAGAFSLVRFRSVPGTAREIGAIFLAMASGLITGMGYLMFAIIFTIIINVAILLLSFITSSMNFKTSREKTLRITIPEDLNFVEIFDDVFEEYTYKHETVSVKTTNMGSMFKLTYNISLKDESKEKAFIDDLRCRNGNLEIAICQKEVNFNEL